MQGSNYFNERAKNCKIKTEALLEELPYYCRDYFIAKETSATPLTLLNYAYDLRIFFDYLTVRYFIKKKPAEVTLDDLDGLTAQEIELFLSYLSFYTINGHEEMCSDRAKSRKLSTVRSFFGYLFSRDKLTANVAAKVSVPKIREKEIIRLDVTSEVNEIADLINTVDSGAGLTSRQRKYHDITRTRDVAMITLFLGTGIRISELVGLNVGDVDLNEMNFVVTRKGGSRAILYFGDEVRIALKDYLVGNRKVDFIKNKDEPLFLSMKGDRISVRAVENLVKKYAQLSAPLKKITPHKLRSSFGTNLYKETHDIYVVADCLGHKDVNTTRKHYAAINEETRKKAIETVKLRDDKK